MKILKTETPKEVRDFPVAEELNPTDVVEIFKTPLTWIRMIFGSVAMCG